MRCGAAPQEVEAWRTVYRTIAALSVVLAAAGMALCVTIARSHAQLLSVKSEYDDLRGRMLQVRARARARGVRCGRSLGLNGVCVSVEGMGGEASRLLHAPR